MSVPVVAACSGWGSGALSGNLRRTRRVPDIPARLPRGRLKIPVGGQQIGGPPRCGQAADVRQLEQADPDLVLTLPARAENVAVVRHAFGGLGDVMDVADQTLSDIKLAVTEACTNVVVHAYPGGEDGPLGVRATVDEATLTVVVSDQGR